MGLEQRLDLRPDARQPGVKFLPLQIAEPQVNHPRRRRLQDDAIRKIRILADDDQFVPSGIMSEVRIVGMPADLGRGDDWQGRRTLQTGRQVLVQQEALHAARTTEK